MSNLLVCKNVEIGGMDFQLSPVMVGPARKVLPILQRCVGAMELTEGKLENFLITAGLGGMLTEKDVDVLMEVFGAVSTVNIPSSSGKDDKRLLLSKEAHLNEVFAGQMELVYEWLEASIDYNFAGTLAKMHTVVAATVAKARAAEAEEAAAKAAE